MNATAADAIRAMEEMAERRGRAAIASGLVKDHDELADVLTMIPLRRQDAELIRAVLAIMDAAGRLDDPGATR